MVGEGFPGGWVSGFPFLDLRTEIVGVQCVAEKLEEASAPMALVFEGGVLNMALPDPHVMADLIAVVTVHQPLVEHPLSARSAVVMEGKGHCLWSCFFSHCAHSSASE